MTRKFLDDVYSSDARDDIAAFYDDWAATYENELAETRYETPGRLARMLSAAGVPKDTLILDYGCGTGLGGLALRAEGYHALHGTDPSAEMLALGVEKKLYAKTWRTDLSAPLPVTPGDYGGIAAIGVISPGAGPAELLDTLTDLLAPGGYLTWSLNSHGMADAAYTSAIENLKSRPDVEVLDEEHGPHLPGRDMTSMVYLIRRT